MVGSESQNKRKPGAESRMKPQRPHGDHRLTASATLPGRKQAHDVPPPPDHLWRPPLAALRPRPVDNRRLTTLPPLPARRGTAGVRIRVEAFGLKPLGAEASAWGSERGRQAFLPGVPGIEAAGTYDGRPPTGQAGLTPGQKVVAMMGDMGRTYDGGLRRVQPSCRCLRSSPGRQPTCAGRCLGALSGDGGAEPPTDRSHRPGPEAGQVRA